MSRSCGVVPVILVLILTVTGTQAQCTQEELYTLYQCILPYNTKFMLTFGTGGSCNRALISEDVCTDFTDIVVCANQKDISRTCRQYALGQIDQSMEIPCKIRDFEEVCKKAPAIDKGGCARASGISLGLLGAVIIVSLIVHM
ncbi:uncharacterized protein LOC112568889 isoform X2 [Pomacea canaliculata]|uniref:uncharacterized protein LOC112568889 isoform X2 n=1 Tax=Pomacea canaliculata TaxID=400727 RepID=UPI000D73B51A|nr:uncharacterized protein LOC112568889 isoform X2 [Pomacea canaliculata]